LRKARGGGKTLFTFETITVLVVLAIFAVFAVAANKAEKAVAAKIKEKLAQKPVQPQKMAASKGRK
jgi:hypothetical protein